MTVVPTAEETQLTKDLTHLMGTNYVVVCLGGLSVHVNGQPTFSIKTYGTFTEEEAGEKAREIARIEGGAVFVRPIVDLADTYRRLSAD